TNILTAVPNVGTLIIDYNFFTIPDTLDVYYQETNIFSSGLLSGSGEFVIPYGRGSETTLTIVMNQAGGATDVTRWQYQPTVVPEPAALSIFGLGLCALTWRITTKPAAFPSAT